jgi:hypothetical protein
MRWMVNVYLIEYDHIHDANGTSAVGRNSLIAKPDGINRVIINSFWKLA